MDQGIRRCAILQMQPMFLVRGLRQQMEILDCPIGRILPGGTPAQWVQLR